MTLTVLLIAMDFLTFTTNFFYLFYFWLSKKVFLVVTTSTWTFRCAWSLCPKTFTVVFSTLSLDTVTFGQQGFDLRFTTIFFILAVFRLLKKKVTSRLGFIFYGLLTDELRLSDELIVEVFWLQEKMGVMIIINEHKFLLRKCIQLFLQVLAHEMF